MAILKFFASQYRPAETFFFLRVIVCRILYSSFQETFAHLLDKNKVIIPILKPQNPIFELVKDEDFHLAPDVDTMRSDEECGVNLSNLKLGDEGFIKTPNYPGNYPPDIQCIWWLKV